jgi:hypothetical protein
MQKVSEDERFAFCACKCEFGSFYATRKSHSLPLE